MDTTKPHIQKAINYCFDNDIPLSKGVLDLVELIHREASNISFNKNLDDIISITENKLNKLFEIKHQHTTLDVLRMDLSKHISNLDSFRNFIKTNKEIKL